MRNDLLADTISMRFKSQISKTMGCIMDNVVYAVMYTMSFSYPELVSIHKTKERAEAARDKMNDDNTSLTQKYIVDTYTLEK